MNIFDQRRTVEQELRKSLSSNFVVVNGPNHPLLLRGPDLLVGGEGRLTAIMLVTVEEARSPLRARARYTLSRAALPPDTVFVVSDRSEKAEVAQLLARDVDEIFDWRNIRDIANIATRQRRSSKTSYSNEVKSRILERFGEAFRVARLFHFAEEHAHRVTRSAAPVGSRALPVQARGHREDYQMQMLPESAGSREIAGLTLDGAELFYLLDNGVPYVSHGSAGTAFITRVPKAAGDPERYLRASAFAGWVLAPAAVPYSTDEMVHLVAERTRSR